MDKSGGKNFEKTWEGLRRCFEIGNGMEEA